MRTSPEDSPRRRQILEALATELENNPGARITTARLAEVVGVSEAALYRHFPSKAKMFEALIVFAEDSVFGRVTRILADEQDALRRCEMILTLLLGFSSHNPGITRVLLGDALIGEHERLRVRVAQFFSRLETQLKQVVREGLQRSAQPSRAPVDAIASLLLAVAEGRMAQFARSGFARSPSEGWEAQWSVLAASLLSDTKADDESGPW